MDINPLIADLNKFKEELIDSIQIAIGLNELHNADRFVAHDIAEIKGEEYKTNFLGNLAQYKDIKFGKDSEPD